MRSIDRMEFPSASALNHRDLFFCAEDVRHKLLFPFPIYCATVNQAVNRLFVAQKRKLPRGRPKFPKGEARSELLRIRVSLTEMKGFEAKAKRANEPLPEWVRKRLTEAE